MESPLHATALADPDLRLIETLGWDGIGFLRLSLHMGRMARGAGALGWVFDGSAAERVLRAAVRTSPRRIRLTCAADGALEVTTAPMPAPVACWRLGLAQARLQSGDLWLTLKSTRRASYDAARTALPGHLDEAVFMNERGEVCDGTITTLFFDAGQGLCTPPLASGLLPGVLRAEMLASGGCREAVLMGLDLPDVRLWAGNSLRGLAPAVWAGGPV